MENKESWWLDMWREVAWLTLNICEEEPRCKRILAILEKGDEAWAARDRPLMQLTRAQLTGLIGTRHDVSGTS